MKTTIQRWAEYHGRAYPGFAKWLARNPDQLSHIERLLRPYSIEQLSEATDALFGASEQPYGYSNHARAIRDLCSPRAFRAAVTEHEGPRVIDDHLTAECPRCMDYGTVEVVKPATLKLIWRHEQRGTHRVSTCTIACDCRRGERKAKRLKLPQWSDGYPLLRYETIVDEAVGCACNCDQLLDAEWAVARRMLLEHYDRTRTPQALDATVLP